MNGGIYFIGYGESDWVKVGYASDFKKRLSALQVASPERLTLEATVAGTYAQEQRLHKAIGGPRRGEWFKRWWVAGELIAPAKEGATIQEIITLADALRETLEQNIEEDKFRQKIRGWLSIANDPTQSDHSRAHCRSLLIEHGAGADLTDEARALVPDLSFIDGLPRSAQAKVRRIYEADGLRSVA